MFFPVITRGKNLFLIRDHIMQKLLVPTWERFLLILDSLFKPGPRPYTMLPCCSYLCLAPQRRKSVQVPIKDFS